MDIFAAAMLGHTDVVKAFVAARPGVQRTMGPHCIPLLAHAQAGGTQAAETAAYLEQLGDAGQSPQTVELSKDKRDAYVGQYRFGQTPADVLEVKVEKERLSVLRPGQTSRLLHCVGDDEFFPAGAPNVRIRFAARGGAIRSLTVIDHVPLTEAVRVER
jgi:hypothetical protein